MVDERKSSKARTKKKKKGLCGFFVFRCCSLSFFASKKGRMKKTKKKTTNKKNKTNRAESNHTLENSFCQFGTCRQKRAKTRKTDRPTNSTNHTTKSSVNQTRSDDDIQKYLLQHLVVVVVVVGVVVVGCVGRERWAHRGWQAATAAARHGQP